MSVVYCVTQELRDRFKQPFGLLLRGTFSETMKQLKALLEREKPSMVVAVGDRVSKNLHEYGIIMHLSVTDNKTLRKWTKAVVLENKNVLHIVNPQGTITDEAITAIQVALQNQAHTHLQVDGEEDLLTLIAVLYAPESAVVVYGQPHEGIVVVKVTKEKRVEAARLLNLMACSKAK